MFRLGKGNIDVDVSILDNNTLWLNTKNEKTIWKDKIHYRAHKKCVFFAT